MVKRSLTSLEPLQRTNYFYGSSPIYAWITIVLTWLASLLPWREWEGAPDILILVLAFWCVQQVRGVGLTSALIFGLLMDVHDVNVMGEHALSYVLVIFGAWCFGAGWCSSVLSARCCRCFPSFFWPPFPVIC
ncbi:rod shape-determining protein [Advenella kashmirensis WT001]|uniref:Rod shape-determining protein n=1 Tax=Advenella kashmirensis (strain DSM 17095 / LMG 22695 / WT001) TaxID=1036672 RepID=I3U9E1_ADVKW|nr:rod shape-determining protein MreD [Advenella kashmirensis]AFK61629.1 rod shape-determining protein [Advenella kashmirensis WT001]